MKYSDGSGISNTETSHMPDRRTDRLAAGGSMTLFSPGIEFLRATPPKPIHAEVLVTVDAHWLGVLHTHKVVRFVGAYEQRWQWIEQSRYNPGYERTNSS